MTRRPRAIGHVGLIARDLNRFVEFYERVLGFRVSDWMTFPPESPFAEGVWMRCNSVHHVISVFRPKQEPPDTLSTARSATPGLHHMGFEMSSLADLLSAVRYAREQGLEIQGMRTGGPGMQLRLYIWDPEDNIVELYWGMDQVGWDAASRPYTPVATIDLEEFDIDAWLEMKGIEFTPPA
ncbi:MAG: VOC family protein [Solirubrobacteraceae bacterium]